MAVKVTRCPHCQTSFRVREEQLDTARGMVRCGSCLQVFRAADYFQADNNPSVATPTNKPKADKPKPIVTKPAEKKADRPTAKVTQPSKKADLDDDFGLIHDDMDEDPISEMLADDPSVDFNLRTPDSNKRIKEKSVLDIDTSALDALDSASLFYSFEQDEDKTNDLTDESWAAALLEDNDRNDSNEQKPAANSMLTAEREVDDFVGFIGDDDDDPIDLDGLAIRPNLAFNTSKSPVDNVADLHAEPLSFGSTTTRNIPWGWFGGILILLIVAFSQVLYFNFDSWARSPQWRPFYTQVCTYLDCSLPKVQNINNMSTQHLVVQTHPSLKGALMVDTLLYNKADYLQPFPDILLVFRDINERVIASRRFTPKQFLSGELAGQSDMSPQSRTHIALEIVDPGPEAVSYHIDLLANH